jgi:uncharacterized protein (DUF433 family)
MSAPIPVEPPLRVDESGAIRVGTTRVLMVLVVRAFQDGATPEEIVQRYDTLHLADVYAVIAFYLRHRAEVDRYLVEWDRQADELQQQIEARQKHLPDLRQRLLSRRANTQ